jgi:hypothetical protein
MGGRTVRSGFTFIILITLLLSVPLTSCSTQNSPLTTPSEFPRGGTDTPISTDENLPATTIKITSNQSATQTKLPTTSFPAILTAEQAERLHQSALKFLAPDQTSAIAMAKSMNFLGVNGYPSTMCGPLAIAALRDAGLLESGIDLGKYFYLDPRPGHNDTLVSSTFPVELYQKIEINQPANKIDFKKSPLMAGDFIYLFAGQGGNFDHIITVDRVDEAGRAYAVTNLNTPEGYIIKEAMLYDPEKPGTGQIYDWTDKKNKELGLTGFGGIWIWRLKKTPVDPDSKVQQFRQSVLAEEKQAGGDWYVYIQEPGQDPIYSESAFMSLHPASTIKVADAVLFFRALDIKGVTDLNQYLDSYGTHSRSFRQLLHAMLVYSEEAATSAIEEWTAGILDPNQTLHDLGYTQTFVSPRQSSAREMAQILTDLYQGKLVNSLAREIILDYLLEETPNDSTLLGVIRPSLGPQDLLYDKRGEIAAQRTVVADLGLLYADGKTYVIAIYAYYNTEHGTGTYEELQAAVESISREFWRLIHPG